MGRCLSEPLGSLNGPGRKLVPAAWSRRVGWDDEMLNVGRLRLLHAVARLGSLTAAAAELNYSTSAVSQQISLLEREAGAPLLERHARGVRLTETGRVLAEHA